MTTHHHEETTMMRVPPSPDATTPTDRTNEPVRVAPQPATGATVAALDLDAIEGRARALTYALGRDHIGAVASFGHTVGDQDVPTLVSEVRRLRVLCIPLTDLSQELDMARQNLHHARAMSAAHFERAEREKTRAESAEAEVVTLRAQVAAVEALADEWHEVADWLYARRAHRKAAPLHAATARLRAALATTGEGE